MLLPELPFQFVCETGDRVYTVTHWREGELVINWVDSSGMKEHTTYDPVDALKLFLEGDWILLASTEAPTELEELEARIETLEEYITQLVRENKSQAKALDNFSRLTYLVSNDGRVAKMLGAYLGDCVVDKILDYLNKEARILSRLELVGID